VGKGVIDGNGVVHWDEDAVGVSGDKVDALMHTAILGSKCVSALFLNLSDYVSVVVH
jgi:hypothetical protein